jgi:hypothetical protein
VDTNDAAQKTLHSIQPVTLPSIFNVYLNRADKKDTEIKTETKTKQSEPVVTEPKDVDKKKAEEMKQLGNKLVGEKDYQGAIKAYTDAIDHDDSNAVYFANRYELLFELSALTLKTEQRHTLKRVIMIWLLMMLKRQFHSMHRMQRHTLV